MNTEKLTRTLLIVLITLLAVNYFFPTPDSTTTATQTGVLLISPQDEYVIPTVPTLRIMNHTDTPVTVDTCRDLRITKGTVVLENLGSIPGFPTTFCRILPISASGSVDIDTMPLYRLFTTPDDFTFRLTITGEGESTVRLHSTTPGFLREFFRTVFYAPIYNFFVFLLSIIPGHNLGFAIILITLVIRVVLLIPQHHMLMSNRRMQEIQPKIRDLQDRLKDDQTKLGTELLALYKSEWVNPLGSCLPMLVQMPILIVLYWVILEITHAANWYYLYPALADFDISQISTTFFGMDLLSIGGVTGLALAIAIGIFQWIQTYISLPATPPPAPPAKKEGSAPDFAPDPRVMQFFMLWWLPLMVALSSYYFPMGIGMYWLIGTLFMIGQQMIVLGYSKKSEQ